MRILALLVAALVGCGGSVAEEPPQDSGADAETCVIASPPTWCPAGVAIGYTCALGTSPRDTRCENIRNDPKIEPHWCC